MENRNSFQKILNVILVCFFVLLSFYEFDLFSFSKKLTDDDLGIKLKYPSNYAVKKINDTKLIIYPLEQNSIHLNEATFKGSMSFVYFIRIEKDEKKVTRESVESYASFFPGYLKAKSFKDCELISYGYMFNNLICEDKSFQIDFIKPIVRYIGIYDSDKFNKESEKILKSISFIDS